VRTFAVTDPRFQYFARRGLWHLQLWHPKAGVSILSPSGLTLGHYEIYPVAGWKHWARDHDDLVRALGTHHPLVPPSAGTLAALEAWLVDDPVAEVHDWAISLVVSTDIPVPATAVTD
jgi:hypothetical protein